MTYTPTQTPPNLDLEGLRKWVADEFTRLSRRYQEDTVPFDPTAINSSITTINSNIAALQTSVAMADDTVSFTAGATALTTATSLTTVSGSIPAGTWDLWGHVYFTSSGATSVSEVQATLGTAANTVNTNLPESFWERRPAAVDWNTIVRCGPLRVVLGSPTTYRLSVRSVFTGGAATATSSLLFGRRIMT